MAIRIMCSPGYVSELREELHFLFDTVSFYVTYKRAIFRNVIQQNKFKGDFHEGQIQPSVQWPPS